MNLDLSPAWISIKTATTATIITFCLGVAIARWMYGYRGKSKGIIDAILTAPIVLPPTVLGFLLLLLLGRNGPLGKLLTSLGVTIIFSWEATVIAAVVVAFPLMYKTALGAFKQIDGNLIACARTLGASEWTLFWRIMLPLAKPGIIAGTLLAFARALGEFGATLMLAGSIPGKTQTIPIAIFFASESGQMDVALAWVLVILAISIGVIATVNLWSESRMQQNPRKIKYRKSLIIASLLPTTDIQPRKFNLGVLLGIFRGRISKRDRFSKPQNYQDSTPHLLVNIQKPLSGFELDVKFETDDRPLGFLGASGAGKSLALRCIAGLETPTAGQIVLNNRVLFDSQRGINLPSRDRKIGYLFQNYALFPHLTIAENIAFGLPKGLSRTAIKQRVEAQLLAVQLPGCGNRYPHQLSGGQQQRIALARAFASQPEILLLDEPLSALDTHLRDSLEKLLVANVSNYRGVTLFVTHNLEEAYRVCQNLLVIEGGKVIANGAKQNIFEHPPTLSVAQLTGCKNFSRAVAVASDRVEAIDWGCTLQTVEAIPDSLSHVGIRAHQITFVEDPDSSSNDPRENIFPCWLAAISETPHRMTLFLKLQQPPNSPQDYHLQAEVFKEKWDLLKERPFPWGVRLHPLRLILV